MLTETTDDRERMAAALQRECLATVPLVPAGVTLQPAAWRADLEGVLRACEILERAARS